MPTLYGRFTRIDLADGVLVAMADDTTVRVTPSTTAPQRADLAADVARLERDQYRGLAITHPLAASVEAVRRELDALLRDAAPATPEARHTASRLLTRAADTVHSARLAAASRGTT